MTEGEVEDKRDSARCPECVFIWVKSEGQNYERLTQKHHILLRHAAVMGIWLQRDLLKMVACVHVRPESGWLLSSRKTSLSEKQA